jgi:YbgC/YbaW family acyl-CoA thioester hydrolase
MKDNLIVDPAAAPGSTATVAGHCTETIVGAAGPEHAVQDQLAFVTHTEHLRVAWVDTDAGGRIHFTAPFRWAELAEHALLRLLDISVDGRFPRRHVEATYHAPLRFGDTFDLRLTLEHVGRTSITYSWKTLRSDTLCIEGRHVVVCVDDRDKPQLVPQLLRSGLSQQRSP